MTETTVRQYANRVGKNERTIQRWVTAYNEKNNTSHPTGLNVVLEENLITHLNKKINYKSSEEIEVKGTLFSPDTTKSKTSVSVPNSSKGRSSASKKRNKKTLQDHLSADWLIIVVLSIILWADMFAFGSIGDHEFGDRMNYASLFFAVIGLATGIGSVVTYNRIENKTTAEAWKWIFGIMQFSVFFLSINEYWVFAELIMTAMFVLVFIGVQRSIKN